ncbi:unnamed protein product, partial [Prorocentrum cordatum]
VCEDFGIRGITFDPTNSLFAGERAKSVGAAINQWVDTNSSGRQSSVFAADPWLVVSGRLGDKYPEPTK